MGQFFHRQNHILLLDLCHNKWALKKGVSMKKSIVFIICLLFLVSCSKDVPTPDPNLIAAQTEIADIKGQLTEKFGGRVIVVPVFAAAIIDHLDLAFGSPGAARQLDNPFQVHD